MASSGQLASRHQQLDRLHQHAAPRSSTSHTCSQGMGMFSSSLYTAWGTYFRAPRYTRLSCLRGWPLGEGTTQGEPVQGEKEAIHWIG